MGQDLAEMAKRHADLILKASGSALRHYTMEKTRSAILMAAMDAIEEAYRSGAQFALEQVRAECLNKRDGK